MRLHEGTISPEDYRSFLNLFSVFKEEDNPKIVFTYVHGDAEAEQLREMFDYGQLVDGRNDFRDMVRLMTWVSDQLIGDGSCKPPSLFDAKNVLLLSRKEHMRSNCYMYAVVLNEVYLSLGFFSRMVRCMPVDLDYNDCHCVTEAYSSAWGKWIAFDAANRAYYVSERGLPLNLFEIRERIRKNQRILVPMMMRASMRHLIDYLARNLIRMECRKVSSIGNENRIEDGTMIHFQSANFPVTDKDVYYSDIGINIQHIHTSDPSLFWSIPEEIRKVDAYENN